MFLKVAFVLYPLGPYVVLMCIEGRIIYQEHEVKFASQQIFSQNFQGTPENKQIIACSFVGFFNELFIGALYRDLFGS